MKNNKKHFSILPLCGLFCLMVACGNVTPFPSPTASTEPSLTPTVSESIEVDGVAYVSLSSVLNENGIEAEWRDGQLVLTEKGIEVALKPECPYLYRRGYLVAVLPSSPLLKDETVYLPQTLFQELFGDGTLFNDILFFKDEVATALEQSDAEPWKSVLAAVELPRSMNVSVPNLDVNRVFQEKLLGDYPSVLAEELTIMGLENSTEYTYSEYILLTESRSVEEAGLKSFFLDNEALKEENPADWTVREYKDWQQAQLLAETEAGLTEAQREFVTEKNILLQDIQWLKKDFYNSYTECTDEELRETIEAYYQMSVDYVIGAE